MKTQTPTPYSELLESYKSGYMAYRNLAENSRRAYELAVHQFFEFLEDCKIYDIRKVGAANINAYLASLDRLGRSGATRRQKLIIIRTLFGWLKSEEVIANNPSKHVIPPLRETKEPRVLTENEYRRLLAVVNKPRDRAIIQLILQTGIRLSEIQRLTLLDIGEIPKRITMETLSIIRILGKGRKTRTVMVNYKACEALQAWLDARPDVETEGVFISSHQKALSKRQFQRLVGKYLEIAGIQGASVHTLRGTFATHHLAAGTDVETVQEFLGHSSLDTTKSYIGLRKQRQAQHIQAHAL